MKKIFALTVAILMIAVTFRISAQEGDPVLLTVAGDNITKTEFLAVYNKNNVKTDVIDIKSLEDYLKLYINFRLKVKEAEELGLDTLKSFITELAGYRKQLAQPYLTDKEVTENLIKEAYERMKTDIRASHILIKVGEDALPKDTLSAWNKIMTIRKRIAGGEDFKKVAMETSEDPSARDRAEGENRPAIKGNGGDLGYFSVLQMYYPFETGAYNLKKDELSNPIRTPLGYHIIKHTDTRSALGQVQVAHIMIKVKPVMTEEEETAAKAKANEIYSKLVAGEDFVELAKQYSEDRGTSNKGGILPWFGTGRMVPEFDSATYLLKTNGDFSKPVRTLYGYHIIKLMDKKPIPTWDDAKSELKVRIQKDGRSRLSKLAVISRIKKDYKFKESRKTIAALYPLIDSSFFAGKWEAPKVNNLTKKMFNIGKNIYTQNDFAKFIESHQTPNVIGSIEVLVNKQYDAFVEDECVKYENERLEDKYPEFKALMKEYRDGILLFELTDQKVWSKAVKDTSGLKAFYDQNKLKYMWGKRADADIYVCKDAAAAEKVAVLLKELAPASDTLNIPKAIQSKINMDSQLNVKIETGLFQVEDHPALSKFAWQEGVSGPISADNSAVLVFIRGIELPRPKTLEEAKGIITADYQTNLENAWIVALKQKYPVKVNEQVLKDIK